MVFSSLLFVFLFLALNLVSQAALRGARQKNIAMLLFSLVFFSWAGPRYVVLLLLDTALCWFFAICIEREPQRKKLHLSLCVALVLLVLGIFKYTGFLMGNLQSLFGWPEVIPQIVLPIGISFYTFQLISYVVDVYRGEVRAQKKYWILLLYASLFHQCIAGPIVRYRDVAAELAIGRNKLYARIRELTGMTPNEFVLKLKLDESIELLNNHPELNISEISDRLGFSSTPYFTKCFKSIYGIAPLNYRKRD